MAFAFSPERIRVIRSHQDQVHAALLMLSDHVVANTVRDLRREYTTHDADGVATGKARSAVQDPVPDEMVEIVGATTVQVIVTVIYVERVDVYDGTGMTLPLAKGCGYKTVSALRDAWLGAHPRSPLAQAVYFAVGDHRDNNRYLQYHSHGGDYTGNPARAVDDLPVLTKAQTESLKVANRQKDVARQAERAEAAMAIPLSEQVAALEAARKTMRVDINREMKAITYEAERARRAETRGRTG